MVISCSISAVSHLLLLSFLQWLTSSCLGWLICYFDIQAFLWQQNQLLMNLRLAQFVAGSSVRKSLYVMNTWATELNSIINSVCCYFLSGYSEQNTLGIYCVILATFLTAFLPRHIGSVMTPVDLGMSIFRSFHIFALCIPSAHNFTRD